MSHIDMEKIDDIEIIYCAGMGPRVKRYRGRLTGIYLGPKKEIAAGDIVIIDAGLSGGTWDLQDVAYGREVSQWYFRNPVSAVQVATMANEGAVPSKLHVANPEPKKEETKPEAEFFESEPEPTTTRKSATKAARS